MRATQCAVDKINVQLVIVAGLQKPRLERFKRSDELLSAAIDAGLLCEIGGLSDGIVDGDITTTEFFLKTLTLPAERGE